MKKIIQNIHYLLLIGCYLQIQSEEELTQTFAPSILDLGVFQTISALQRPEIPCLALSAAHIMQTGEMPNILAPAATQLLQGASYGLGEKFGISIEDKLKQLEQLIAQFNKPLISALVATLCGLVIYLLQTNSIEENLAEDALQTALTSLATYNIKTVSAVILKQITILSQKISSKKQLIFCTASITALGGTCYYLSDIWLPTMYSLGNTLLKTTTLEFINTKAVNAYCWLQGYRYTKNKESIATELEVEKQEDVKEY
jgi:hypothetical protein